MPTHAQILPIRNGKYVSTSSENHMGIRLNSSNFQY